MKKEEDRVWVRPGSIQFLVGSDLTCVQKPNNSKQQGCHLFAPFSLRSSRSTYPKTFPFKNIGTVDTHVADYQRMIGNLQIEVCRLRKELAEKDSQLSVTAEKAVDDELSWLNVISHETSENVQECINLQKVLFELEETDLRNRIKLQHLDDAIAKQQLGEDLEVGSVVLTADFFSVYTRVGSLAQQLIDEKPQVIQEYKSGKAIPNQQMITKLERVLGVKLRGKK